MQLYLFDRTEKIIHFDDLSILDKRDEIGTCVQVEMSENEVFVFQIALLSQYDDKVEAITSQGNIDISCINTDIVDKFGNSGKQSIALKSNCIQPLFFTASADTVGKRDEKCTVTIKTVRETRSFEMFFKINSDKIENRGYNDLWRLSRIKWLNSDLCIDDTAVQPYTPPEIKDGSFAVLGREIKLGKCGLPEQIYSKFSEAVEIQEEISEKLFQKPAVFSVDNVPLPEGVTHNEMLGNRIESVTVCGNDLYSAVVKSVLRYEGLLEYSVKITPKTDFQAENVCLDFYISPECSKLMHGLGHRASEAQDIEFKWDNQKQQDSLFIGCVNCGMRVKLKAENYIRPLINIFYKNLPLKTPAETWDNNGHGGISVKKENQCTHISAFTGVYDFKKDETRDFLFELHITPLKPIDYKKAFSVRYCHNSRLKDEIKEIDTASKNGLTHVIFHQGNMIMPFINYPFYETDRLKNAVKYAAEKGIGIKLYYTEREHSNHMAETFVYKALGDEIILRKQGVSHSWQKEKPQWLIDNFGEDIIPGWFVKYKHGKYKNDHDISFIVRPDTRLDNYYIEGLNWLVDNIGIKGIYIDDTSLDRATLERAKKVLQKTDGLIDMHMWNHEEERAGDVSCMNLYTEIIPFLDSIWLGEGFFYKKYSPEYMLAEVSGIPYGVTGQMLEGGGDLYLGMLYAMNNRYGWNFKNAVHMYKIWDDFGIEESRMLGYWHSKNPIKTDNENVLSTVYLKENEVLLCLYNFENKAQDFRVLINRQKLEFEPKSFFEIRFGKGRRKIRSLDKRFRLGKRKGIIIYLRG